MSRLIVSIVFSSSVSLSVSVISIVMKVDANLIATGSVTSRPKSPFSSAQFRSYLTVRGLLSVISSSALTLPFLSGALALAAALVGGCLPPTAMDSNES